MRENMAKKIIEEIILITGMDQKKLANYLGTSYFFLMRVSRGDIHPSLDFSLQLESVLESIKNNGGNINMNDSKGTFASKGIRNSSSYEKYEEEITFSAALHPPLIKRLKKNTLWSGGSELLSEILSDHSDKAKTVTEAVANGVSAGKNTYTYDAHTYHTKVPPQGIAQVINKYLPSGGLVFDPFSGSGMTGVAALATGNDVILNEISPAASFISDRFTSRCEAAILDAAVKKVLSNLKALRNSLYTTKCRCCQKDTEILYTIWSYKVKCYCCSHEFILWDESRSYGNNVKEHKFLKEFPCPKCKETVKKSKLERTSAVPVILGYKCCSKKISEVELTENDLNLIKSINKNLDECQFIPDYDLPDGVNLSQPKRRGLTNVKDFYTNRNLLAMSKIWEEINKVDDDNLSAFLGFIFTSLYKRVTKLSEYRFWGGSGNTANFNVPYIFNEANVFTTFERKARSVIDHLESTVKSYSGRCVVNTGSATELNILPDNSVDLIFTDPPFGANINYSEMNIIWESWLGEFTQIENEAIVNKSQNKNADTYQKLITESLSECYRVLRDDHWMILVFMNSSKDIWDRIRNSILDAGFKIERVDIFDKQHGTFKQFVSDNTAGSDLMLHCRKVPKMFTPISKGIHKETLSVTDFLSERNDHIPMLPYLHVKRKTDIDYRTLYSEYLSHAIPKNWKMLDFATFRSEVLSYVKKLEG
ncbi:DNA methyltransferase [Pantoea sp. Ep11b]|uniref:DNA methyltransferase n=1 Tax=Pantoea sp. Ep11b TaxID=3141459 RepID=UPI0034605DA1